MRLSNAAAPIPARLNALQRSAATSNLALQHESQNLHNTDTVIMGSTFNGVFASDKQSATLNADAKREAAIDAEMKTNDNFTDDLKQWKDADEEIMSEAEALARLVRNGQASLWQKAIWSAWIEKDPLPDNVAGFFDNYIHDSQVSWIHAFDAGAVAYKQIGASRICSAAFSKQAQVYCQAVEDDSYAGRVEFLRPRTMFFGEKENVFSAFDTGY